MATADPPTCSTAGTGTGSPPTSPRNCELVDQARNVTIKGRQQYLEQEQAWVLFTGTGHNDGPLGELPATGRAATVPFCEVREYDTDGKFVRAEWYYDQLTMLTQLGHMQPPAE